LVRLAAQVTAGRDAPCEAPTGTGKSLAVLAAGLDWLAAAPGRQVVLSTHTKQLQSQLAGDIAKLTTVVPGLADISALVKGKRNLISLADAMTTAGAPAYEEALLPDLLTDLTQGQPLT
jgi:ATP-dependent DNA helicase RecQ